MPALDTQVPQWLVQQSLWYSGEQRLHENALFDLQMQEGKQKIASNFLSLQQQQQSLDENAIKMRQQSMGIDEVDNWMKQSNGDPVWMVNHPYTGTNPVAASQIGSTQIRAAGSMTVQKAQDDLVMFNKRILMLSPEARAGIGQMSDSQRTGLPTPEKWKALELAEQAEQIHQENVRTQAEIEAKRAGDLRTTTIGAKGVETTFKTAPASNALLSPKSMILPNGSTVTWMPGGKTLHVINQQNKHTEMTTQQLRLLAKSLLDEDEDDPYGKQIMEFLRDKAVNQITGDIPSSKSSVSGSTHHIVPSSPSSSKPADPLGLFQ